MNGFRTETDEVPDHIRIGKMRLWVSFLGMDERNIYPEGANALDEMAAAMLERNFEYAEDHIHDANIPTFHVQHSGSDEEEERYRYDRHPVRPSYYDR